MPTCATTTPPSRRRTTLPSLDALVPLSPLPWTSRVAGASNGVRVYDGNGYALPGCFSCGENDAVYEPGDGALIAAAPDLLAAVRDVLALHRPQPYGREGDPPFVPRLVCDHCLAQHDGAVEYPCPTVRALATHLDLTDPEGDPT